MSTYTVVVTMGDIRTTSQYRRNASRWSATAMEGFMDRVDNLLDVTYTRIYSPVGGQWQGEREGTAVVIGTTDTQGLAALGNMLPSLAYYMEQEAIGLIVQEGTDTLVEAPPVILRADQEDPNASE